jgi:beta-phosphoglucomutase
MIRAMIFDLDGTLVQTEKLKAASYARAAVELRPDTLLEEQVVEAFKGVVGLPRREVAQRLVEMFNLEEAAQARNEEFGVSAPWQTFVQIRLKHYEGMLADPEVIRTNQWPPNLTVLDEAHRA